jgi:tetratricopeptide (TPR) repeat protein
MQTEDLDHKPPDFERFWSMKRAPFRAILSVLFVIGILAASLAQGVPQRNSNLSSPAHALFVTETADLKAGNFWGAANSFEEFIRLDDQFGPAFVNLGLAYHSLGQYQKAIQFFKRALELDSNSTS